jgi:hypothetical protein
MNNEEVKTKINQTIGLNGTWFFFEEDRDTFFLRSREYGDISEEEPGKEDIAEANRLIKLLREAGIKAKGEVIDEWVEVIVQKPEPKIDLQEQRKADKGFAWIEVEAEAWQKTLKGATATKWVYVRQAPQPTTPYEKKQLAYLGRFSPVVGPKAKLP